MPTVPIKQRWLVVLVDANGNLFPEVGVWAEETKRMAKMRADQVNEDDWNIYHESGYRALVLGKHAFPHRVYPGKLFAPPKKKPNKAAAKKKK